MFLHYPAIISAESATIVALSGEEDLPEAVIRSLALLSSQCRRETFTEN